MRPVGYLVNTERGPTGESGLFYDYILAQNGLFIQAENGLMKAVIRVAAAKVRGLIPLDEALTLPAGKIPRRLLGWALSVLKATPNEEGFLAITWDDGYRLRMPPQEGTAGGVRYHRPRNVVLEVHSHGTTRAFFSATDDSDEQGFAIYMVAGRLHQASPEVLLRVGIYGHFSPIRLEAAFS